MQNLWKSKGLKNTMYLTEDELARYVATKMAADLEDKIKLALMPHVEKVVDDAVKDLCKNLNIELIHRKNPFGHPDHVEIVISSVGSQL